MADALEMDVKIQWPAWLVAYMEATPDDRAVFDAAISGMVASMNRLSTSFERATAGATAFSEALRQLDETSRRVSIPPLGGR